MLSCAATSTRCVEKAGGIEGFDYVGKREERCRAELIDVTTIEVGMAASS